MPPYLHFFLSSFLSFFLQLELRTYIGPDSQVPMFAFDNFILPDYIKLLDKRLH